MSPLLSGVFLDGPLIGVGYSTPSQSGVTDHDGFFTYQKGELVTFSIGALTVGHAVGSPSLTLASLQSSASNAEHSMDLAHHEVINRARFVLSLGPDGDLRDGVTVSEKIRAVVNQHAADISFEADVAAFEKNVSLQAVFKELQYRLRGPAEARNHIRRRLQGIRVLRDVKVPTRDGSYLIADVFVPLAPGVYPVLLHQGIYGRAFRIGSIHNAAEQQASEQREADWYEDAEGREKIYHYFRYSEAAVAANSSDWVPRGYVLVRVDRRGVGQTPGIVAPFSPQEARDYYDAIEWAAAEPWSNGKVGLYGGSYNATVQWPVASLQPPSLKAIAPLACDTDGYRELAYPGGIFLEKYRQWWWKTMATGPSKTPKSEVVDFIGDLNRHPFDDGHYRGETPYSIAATDFSRIKIPVLTAVSQTAWIHGRGGFEAFTRVPSPHKQLLIYDATYTYNLYRDFKSDVEVFFDRYLKDIQPAEEPAAVRLVMRTGHGKYEIKEAANWPIPGTTYQELFLAANNTSDGVGTLTPAAPAQEVYVEYSADVTAAKDLPMAVFETKPLTEDIELAGHFRATIWGTSTTEDADFFVAVRVMDGEREVQYRSAEPDSVAALTSGVLRATHRTTDPHLSNAERPWHTHREEDFAPLSPNVPVRMEIELLAATARVPAGHRLRIEISPAEGKGTPPEWARRYDETYHSGAVNRIYTGGKNPSSVTIPVVPRFK
ncbi:Alpha/Beta hydrolase protein [Leptodontidium sp. 2 PMI_412]|nr:Alpha/Beta hydrolase protein [Leptodontidium sp. 2 PMI_412]